ncbi:glycosyltransferase family 2 protein [Desulfopila sp. IMCC35008]|uniref:glycosyltransferase family 2 protein n=1 Tax=Desulfopila sp. IMCC35008 TaxID=2653858 RepID=UPI0013D25CCF|nr:glycosyltransferase family 2 protein [Desulfopila sp. IMCC35008]
MTLSQVNNSNPSISVVIPVFNSKDSLIELCNRLDQVFRTVCRESFEIVFVDDCSINAGTWSTLVKLSREHSFVHALQLSKNFGQPAAIIAGMAHSRGKWIVTMDDDLQHRPEDIPRLLSKRDHDVVIGKFTEKRCSTVKKMSSNIKSYFDIFLLGKPKELATSPFRLIKRRVVSEILKIQTSRPFPIAMLLSVTSDIVNIDVPHEVRKYGKSNYNLRKSFSLFSNMLFNNSSLMLRLMSYFGFCLFLISIGLGGFLVLKKVMSNQAVPGWTSLIVVTLVSTGSIIFCLGLLGEYIARLLAAVEKQRTWAVKESTFIGGDGQN